MIRGIEHLERAHYDDPETYEFAAGGSPTENVAERLAIIEPHTRGRRLLDVGAGKGEFVAGATAAGFDAVGVEPSARFCEHARRAHGVTMHQGVLHDVDTLASARFDVVTALHVLEHVDDPHEFVDSLRNHARAGRSRGDRGPQRRVDSAACRRLVSPPPRASVVDSGVTAPPAVPPSCLHTRITRTSRPRSWARAR